MKQDLTLFEPRPEDDRAESPQARKRLVSIQEIKDAAARVKAAKDEMGRAEWAFETMAAADHEHEWERPEEGGPLMCTCNASYSEEGEEGL